MSESIVLFILFLLSILKKIVAVNMINWLLLTYAITRVPNPITGGRAVPINEIGIAIIVFEIAYIVITVLILVKERRMRVSDKEHLR